MSWQGWFSRPTRCWMHPRHGAHFVPWTMSSEGTVLCLQPDWSQTRFQCQYKGYAPCQTRSGNTPELVGNSRRILLHGARTVRLVATRVLTATPQPPHRALPTTLGAGLRFTALVPDFALHLPFCQIPLRRHKLAIFRQRVPSTRALLHFMAGLQTGHARTTGLKWLVPGQLAPEMLLQIVYGKGIIASSS